MSTYTQTGLRELNETPPHPPAPPAYVPTGKTLFINLFLPHNTCIRSLAYCCTLFSHTTRSRLLSLSLMFHPEAFSQAVFPIHSQDMTITILSRTLSYPFCNFTIYPQSSPFHIRYLMHSSVTITPFFLTSFILRKGSSSILILDRSPLLAVHISQP